VSEWSTYTLSDLLMFSARTYFRLLELYNRDTWPLHLLAAGAGVALVLCARRTDARSGRIAAILLGLCWLWVAWAFHTARYATINSAAPYFATGFVFQGALLLFAGHLPANRDRPGLVLLLLALLGYPLLALLALLRRLRGNR
jgi:peptidoglycan/LPS O-acetylase OafA/YrhL